MCVMFNDALCHEVYRGRGIEGVGIPSPNTGRTQWEAGPIPEFTVCSAYKQYICIRGENIPTEDGGPLCRT
jgi:hypothetical protein